ncbi:MAG: metallophosphoesterase family protein, partial [Solirubrobacterales bacterium]
MRVAVISDVHGNLPALEAVLAKIDAERVDELWCLGDLVGYGADPDACTELVTARADICLAGNHDLVVGAKARPVGAFGD